MSNLSDIPLSLTISIGHAYDAERKDRRVVLVLEHSRVTLSPAAASIIAEMLLYWAQHKMPDQVDEQDNPKTFEVVRHEPISISDLEKE